MKVAIDCYAMKFICAHTSFFVVNAFVHLECNNLFNVDYEDSNSEYFLKKFTTIDLARLLTNTTGETFHFNATNEERRNVLRFVCNTLPQLDIVYAEIEAQIAACNPVALEKGTCANYVKGAKLPKQSEGFTDYLAAKPALAAYASGQAAPPASAPIRPASAPPLPAKAASPAPVTTGQRPSVGAIIAEFADKRWKEAGQPRDVKVVLQMRKEWMAELETMGYKSTSASNYLGAWMKTRL